MIATELKALLDQSGVAYETIAHTPAYTSPETAQRAHLPTGDLAKTVIVNVDGKLAMAVLPATRDLDLARLKEVAGAREAYLASEWEFSPMFPGCERGAMPPFGKLYGLQVLADAALATHPSLAFNAGSHEELVRMSYADFERLARPQVADIGKPHAGRLHQDTSRPYMAG